MENLVTSGTGLDSESYPRELRPLAESLNRGLCDLLAGTYGMKLREGKWVPKTIEELFPT
jgi:hypothetical protein